MRRHDRHRHSNPSRRARRGLLTALIVGVVAIGVAAPAAAQGPDPARLAAAGWFCFSHTPEAVHCLPDGDAVLSGEAATSTILTFAADTNEFWGTELLIRQDLYHGQPCPQDDVGGQPTTYIPLSALGLPLPYFVCHHFDSPLT